MSEWDYVSPLLPESVPTPWDHPLDGMADEEWIGLTAPGTSLDYEDLAPSSLTTTPERLHWVAQRMAGSTDGSPPSRGPRVTSASIALGSLVELFSGAFMVRPNGEPDVTITNTSQYKSHPEGGVTMAGYSFGVRGGSEPGAFIRVEGRISAADNTHDSDRNCTWRGGSETYSLPRTFPDDAPQGSRVQVGAYAQVGEYYLVGPGCTGSGQQGPGMVFDAEWIESQLFYGSWLSTTQQTLDECRGHIRISLQYPLIGEAIDEVFLTYPKFSNGYEPAPDFTPAPRVSGSPKSSTQVDIQLHASDIGQENPNYIVVTTEHNNGRRLNYFEMSGPTGMIPCE